jgi:tetratricopeptide (TPR) repeat protein
MITAQRFEPAQPPPAPSLPKRELSDLMPPTDPPPRSIGKPLPRKTVRSLTFVLGLGALLATGIGVFVFLPDYATKDKARPSEAKAPPRAGLVTQSPSARLAGKAPEISAQPTQGRLSASAGVATAAERQRAEAALGDWLQAHARLEARQISKWGSTVYAEATTKAAAGDRALQEADYTAASARFGEALAMLDRLEETIPEVLEETLEVGDQALENGNAKAALQAFRLALALVPEHAGAKRGLGRAGKLERVLGLLATGEAHERQGRLAQAYADFQAAVRLDSELLQAQAALTRIKGRIANERFQAAMSEGFNALQGGRFQEALEAFHKAKDFRPEALEVKDGITQAAQGLRLEKIEKLRQRALDLEVAERWDDALAAYQAALAIDPTLAFAQQGRDRSQRLGQVAAKLQYYLDRPELLTSVRVYRRGQAFLAEASAMAASGPKLKEQLRRFEAQLVLAGTPLALELRSDGATEVMIYRVGKLGRFTTQTVDLRPGTYIVVGVRPGYRDVRRTLTLTPGKPPSPVYIACQERV